MYRPDKQREIKEKHWRGLVEKARRQAASPREVVEKMRHITEQICLLNDLGPGTWPHNLLLDLIKLLTKKSIFTHKDSVRFRDAYDRLLEAAVEG